MENLDRVRGQKMQVKSVDANQKEEQDRTNDPCGFILESNGG